MSKLFAMVVPVSQGKEKEWREFASELNGNRKKEFQASRRNAGIRERVFLQRTPMGDMVIVTFEGENPEAFISQFSAAGDDFSKWFLESVKRLHGIDLTESPSEPVSELVVDSGS
jgi:hypothetical protein